jgi:hypothetical protein
MFFAHKQMSARIVTAVFIAIAVFAIYSWYSTSLHVTAEGFDVDSQAYETVLVKSPSVEAPRHRTVEPAGPGAPNQRPSPLSPPELLPAEVARDPQDKNYESAEMPERLRHPERSFGPGLVNEETSQAVASGVASYASAATASSFQSFGPEYVQNGSQFLENGVMANDVTLETGYSSI